MAPTGLGALRLVSPEQPSLFEEGADVIVEHQEDGPTNNVDEDGNILSIEHADGSITISLDGKPVESIDRERNTKWFRNLAEEIPDQELSRIADDLMRGIQDDITSRTDWIDDRAQGIKLLGLKVEMPGGSSAEAPVEGMSRVRHPLLLEAVLRFQANARSEFLPTDGPTKIRVDDNNADLPEDQLANSFQKDINHYLTVTASEYYPDTDRMFLLLGFGGTQFKKVYFCPLRNRPVSETVDADDLIVNNAATDLENARRITHRIFMRPSTVRRMQLIEVYRDVDLGTPRAPTLDAAQQEKNDQQGIRQETMNPDDRDREIYECYCELDITGFEHKFKGKPSGLEVPYRVTIDVTTREILSIVRNYDKSTEELPVARKNFVKYTFVPGLGFYDIGLLHILGNTTNAVTAAWREMLDAGMFANFPGFLMSDTGGRQNTNIFRVPPGGGAMVKTGGMKISDAIMPLPYKEPGPAMMSLVQNMVETGQRVGGTAELAVGEGRQDAPVGTTLAMIDQAVKILNSVHKRMHTAQSEELELIVQCFRENPESFWKRNRKPATQWDQETFERALDNYNLIPQADPNTSSQTQRIMKIMGLKQLQASNPNLYDAQAVDTAAMQALGWSNPERFMKSKEQIEQMPPEMLKEIEKIKLEKQKADNDTMRTKSQVSKDAATIAIEQSKIILAEQQQGIDGQPDTPEQIDPSREIDAQAKLLSAQASAEANKIKLFDAHIDAENREKDRESRESLALAKIVQEGLKDNEGLGTGSKAFVEQIMTPDFIDRLKYDNEGRRGRKSGGRVVERVVEKQDQELVGSIKELIEEIRAEKEFVRDDKGKIVGARRKKKKPEDDIIIEHE